MKRNIILSIMFLIASIFVFTSCGSEPSFGGQFSQEEFVFSLGQSVDLLDQLQLNGVEKEDVKIEMPTQIVQDNEDGTYTAKASGRGMICASYNGQTFATANVVVKAKFDAPTNITIGANGEVSWDQVYTYFDGKPVVAQSYTVTVNGQSTDVEQNSYTLTGEGYYTLSIKAKAQGKYIDESQEATKIVDFQVMQVPQIVSLTSADDINTSGKMRLEWQAQSGAHFDVYMDGIKVVSDITSTSAELNFANYAGGHSVAVEVVARDAQSSNGKYPASNKITITKRTDINPTFYFDGQDCIVRWTGREAEYVVGYNGQKLDGSVFEQDGYYASVLSGVEEQGLFDVQVQAKGGKVGEEYFADGNVALLRNVAKLAKPSFTYQFTQNELILNIAQDPSGYVKRYKISVQGEDQYITSQQARYSLSNLQSGEVDVKVYALVALDEDGNIVPATVNGVQTSSVLPSEPAQELLYNLTAPDTVVHNLTPEGNSVISFDKIDGTDADSFSVLLNGSAVENVLVSEVQDGSTKTTIAIERLADYLPEGNAYRFVISVKRTDGKSNQLQIEKTITILPCVQKAEREDNSLAYYQWQKLDQTDVEYAYTIYNSNKDGAQNEIAQQDTTSGTQNKQPLSFGYYKIEVVAKSTNTDKYLDADFGAKIEQCKLQDSFIVSLQIVSPQITFEYTNGAYILNIPNVQYAGKFEVEASYEGTVLERGVVPTTGALENYVHEFKELAFGDNNGDAKTYTITVVANVGTDGDADLHPQSQAAQILVTRLGQAKDSDFTVDETEQLSVTLPQGAQKAIIKIDGDIANPDGSNTASLQSIKGGPAIVSIQFVAAAAQDGHYYLDSIEDEDSGFVFERFAAPKNIVYYNGLLTYDCDSEDVQLYKIRLTFSREGREDYIVVLECDSKEFDLQQYILQQSQNEDFYSAYSQAQKINIEVQAYSGTGENVYYLPSAFASIGSAITRLAQTTVSVVVDEAQSPYKVTLQWLPVGDSVSAATVYTVYVNGSLWRTDDQITGTSIDISNFNFTQDVNIYVEASNLYYLPSARSNEIAVRQLGAIDSLQVLADQSGVIGRVASQDITKVAQLLVNDKDILTDSSQAQFEQNGNITIKFVDLSSFTILLKPINPEVILNITHYYILSNKTQYTFKNLASESVRLTKGDSEIEYTTLAQDLAPFVKTNPLAYKLTISQGEQVVAVYDDIGPSPLSLADEKLKKLVAGLYTLQIDGMLSGYTINAVDGRATGYYGSVTVGSTTTQKLQAFPQEYTVRVVETSGDDIEKRKNGGIEIRWKNIWKGIDGIQFDIDYDINYPGLPSGLLKNLSAPYQSLLNLLTLKFDGADQNEYVFTISSAIASYFAEPGNASIPVLVHSAGNISGDQTQIVISKIYAVSDDSIKVESDGTLTFGGVANADEYIVKLTFTEAARQNIQYLRTGGKTSINIMDKFTEYGTSGYTGAYDIDVYADTAPNSNYLPAPDVGSLSGYRLKGLETATVQPDGRVVMQISTQDLNYASQQQLDEGYFEFVAIYTPFETQQSYSLPKEELLQGDGEGEFVFTTANFVKLFGEQNLPDEVVLQFDLYIRLPNCVISAGVPCQFKFVKGESAQLQIKRRVRVVQDEKTEDKTIDYLVLTDDVDNTTGLSISYSYLQIDEDPEIPPKTTTVPVNIQAADLLGYWIVRTSDGWEWFDKTSPDTAEYTATKCLALNINQQLVTLGGGLYTFSINRMAYDAASGLFTQYGTTQIEFEKLVEVAEREIRLVDEQLLWTRVDKENGYAIQIFESPSAETPLATYETGATFFDLTEYIKENDSFQTYYVSVSAISFEKGQLASKESTRFGISRYKNPTPVVVENGEIHFEEESVKQMPLFKDIEANLGSLPNTTRKILSTTYTQPFTFTASNLVNMRVQLRLTSQSGTYYITLRALDLLGSEFKNYIVPTREVTYLSILQDCANAATGEDATQMRNLYNALNGSLGSLGASRQLFDEYGDAIPAGVYSIEIRQTGFSLDLASDTGVLPSGFTACSTQSLTQQPGIVLKSEPARNSNKNIYYLAFAPVEVASRAVDGQVSTAPAQKYVLVLSRDGQVREFEINFEGEKWWLHSEKGEPLFELSQSDGLLQIDLTQDFARKIEDLSSEESSVCIYAVGNNYAINSKTDSKQISFLTFDYQSLRLNNGVLTWTNHSETGTRVSYHQGLAPQAYDETFLGTGRQTLSLSADGLYEYVEFSSLGGRSENAVAVDSPTYRITNLYKRADPKPSVVAGLIHIENGGEVGGYVDFAQFNISNNVTGKNNFVTTPLQPAGQSYNYQAGNLSESQSEGDLQVKTGELSANKFYISSAGNTITTADGAPHFTLSDGNNQYDYLLNIASEQISYVILQSEQAELDAQMLQPVSDGKLVDGNLVYNIAYSAADAQTGISGGEIGYRIKVYEYRSTDSGASEQSIQTFYTLNLAYASQSIIKNIYTNFYSISVTPLAFKKSDTPTSIRTLEGDYLEYADSARYTNITYTDGQAQATLTKVAVLQGSETSYGQRYLVKLVAPETVNIEGGTITLRTALNFVWDSETANNLIQLPEDIRQRISFRIMKSTVGTDAPSVEVKGKVVDLRFEEEGGVHFARATFIPAEGELEYGSPFTLTAYAYITGEQSLEVREDQSLEEEGFKYLTSFGNTIDKEIYKLKAISKSELSFAYSLNDNTYTLSFADYFAGSQILQSSAYGKVVVSVEGLKDSIDVYSTDPVLKFKLDSNIRSPLYDNANKTVLLVGQTQLSFQVVSSGLVSGRNEVIGSDKCDSITLRTSEFAPSDSLDWVDNTFVWTSEKLSEDFDGQIEQKQFFVVVQYQDQSTEVSGIIIPQSADELYYQPGKPGNINKAEVYVRNGEFAFFSTQPLSKTGDFTFNIFEGGTGAEGDPYQIKTAEQLLNIAMRNKSGTKTYFKLVDDIDVSINGNLFATYYADKQADASLLTQAFLGNLDGAEHKLRITFTGASALASQISGQLPTERAATLEDYSFRQGCSLFPAIANGAQVENLDIEVTYQQTGINQNTLVAALAAVNNGTIRQINLNKLTLLASVSSSVLVGVSGLVGDNYSTLTQCNINLDGTYQITSVDNFEPKLLLCGAALKSSDDGGAISEVVASGNATIQTLRNNTKIWACGIVGCLVRGSSVLNSGNDVNFTVSGVGSVNTISAYVGGIALRALSTTSFTMCYNNGTISLPANSFGGGIAYSIVEANLNYVVDTNRSGVIAYIARNVKTEQCYGNTQDSSGYQPQPQETQQMQLQYNGYNLVVDENGKASLEKA